MPIIGRAPGKLVVLGEYAVLTGAPALVMAADRYCVARIDTGPEDGSRLTTFMPEPRETRFSAGRETGVELVDIVIAALGTSGRNWSGSLDSRDFFAGGNKLGLGSSAAALCAFAGAWSAYLSRVTGCESLINTNKLIELHRRFQGGGSGLDVAAAATGGMITYRLDADETPAIGSVRVPNSVGFAGVFAGNSASTPDFVAKFNAWRAERPAECAKHMAAMGEVSARGCEALDSGDVDGFVAAVAEYGRQLAVLGRFIDAEIVTAEHAALAELASRFGVVYKVSGAGGGDVGLAVCADSVALRDFERAVRERDFVWVELGIDHLGLNVEDRV
jgi:phosphomevalonate kinase